MFLFIHVYCVKIPIQYSKVKTKNAIYKYSIIKYPIKPKPSLIH